jgi:hypothetical protein
MVAERFKVLDSLCGPMNDQMIEHASQLVEAIKTAYHVNYSDSHRQIVDYELMYVPIPKQSNGLVGFSTFSDYASAFICWLFLICVLFINFLFPLFSTDCGFFMLKSLELWNGKHCPYRISGYDARIEEKADVFGVESSSESPTELEVLLEENMIL